MRLLKLVFILALAPAFSFAQRGGGGHGAGGGGRAIGGSRMGGGGGFRGGGFRGGSAGISPRGSMGAVSGAYRGGGSFNRGFNGGFNRGFNGGFNRGFNRGFGFNNFRSAFIVQPFFGFGFGWPYWGYGWGYGSPYSGYGYGYGYPSYPYGGYGGYYGGGDPYDNYGYSYPDSGYISQQTPPVVINQGYVPTPSSASGASEFYNRKPDYYLIAFNDHTIQAALSYHVDSGQIYWTTREHEEKQAPLSTLDRSFTVQINRDRHVEFLLPQ